MLRAECKQKQKQPQPFKSSPEVNRTPEAIHSSSIKRRRTRTRTRAITIYRPDSNIAIRSAWRIQIRIEIQHWQRVATARDKRRGDKAFFMEAHHLCVQVPTMPRFAKYAMRAGKSHLHNMKCKCSRVDKVLVGAVRAFACLLLSLYHRGRTVTHAIASRNGQSRQGTRNRLMLT